MVQLQESELDGSTLLRLDPPPYSAEEEVETSEGMTVDVTPLAQEAAVESSAPVSVATSFLRFIRSLHFDVQAV